MSDKIITLTAQNFDQEIAHGTWLVDFWATWCGPCRMQGKLIDDNIDLLLVNGAKVGKVNVDDEQSLAIRYNVQSIPTLLVFKNGELSRQFVGVQAIATLRSAME